MTLRVWFTALALAWGGVAAFAQSGGGFDLSWSTINGGGGTSTGGVYSVSGTIGQPDAGLLAGGNYQLTGGFWGASRLFKHPARRCSPSNPPAAV